MTFRKREEGRLFREFRVVDATWSTCGTVICNAGEGTSFHYKFSIDDEQNRPPERMSSIQKRKAQGTGPCNMATERGGWVLQINERDQWDEAMAAG